MNLKEIEKEFDKRFVKKQDLLSASEENPIIIGVEPPVDEVKKFIKNTVIKEVLREVIGKEIKPPKLEETNPNELSMACIRNMNKQLEFNYQYMYGYNEKRDEIKKLAKDKYNIEL